MLLRTFLLCLTLLAASTWAAPTADTLVGHYTYSFGPLPVYEAKLFSATGTYNPQQPFKLTITYRLGISGNRIAGGSLREWRKQGYSPTDIDNWQPKLTALLPDVSGGDTVTNLYDGHTLTVVKNSTLVGQSAKPVFIKAFFNLWLSVLGSEPAQGHALTGQ